MYITEQKTVSQRPLLLLWFVFSRQTVAEGLSKSSKTPTHFRATLGRFCIKDEICDYRLAAHNQEPYTENVI